MSEIKKYNSKNDSVDLKSADARKNDNNVGVNATLGDARKMKMASGGSHKAKRKRAPIAADIIAGVLIATIAIAIVVGTVYLFKYQSNDYGTIEVEYKMVMYCENGAAYYRPMRNKSLYLDEENNSIYLGKVTDIQFQTDSEGNDVAILSVSADVKYRKNDGYSIGDHRIAVGGEYTVRAEDISAYGVIVELNSASAKGGK